ncbi:hypothetical protein LCGC14_0741760 [marine sediment metagenome]|uniref:Uncharacterized protein n=1 Tax=marine sediment metagenome TaxID=412755 RepID=A0A0F9QRH9_9ZZZZ|nr:hypothetical protein [bacterium]
MPYVLDPKKIRKKSDTLYKEMLLLKKDSIAREKKFREYLTKNFFEQGLNPPEFEEKLEVRQKKSNPTEIYNVQKIKCWEFQPEEVKTGVQKNIEGWDRCIISNQLGDTFNVSGVAHIIVDDREGYKIKELTSDDDMFYIEFQPSTEVDFSYIKQTTVGGDIGIYTDIDVGEIMRLTPSMYKAKLQKKGYDKNTIGIFMQERKELFQSGIPLKLRKRLTAIKKSKPEDIK